jgi:hypothetical protein
MKRKLDGWIMAGLIALGFRTHCPWRDGPIATGKENKTKEM